MKKKTAVVVKKSNEITAAKLAAQYERTSASCKDAVKDMVIFGAMLEVVNNQIIRLSTAVDNLKKHDPSGDGLSLKSWLESNCPLIDYKRAMSYRDAARGLKRLCSIRDDVPLLPLMGEDPLPEGESEQCRERLLDVITKEPLNALRLAARESVHAGGTRAGAGRPKGSTKAMKEALIDPDLEAEAAASLTAKLYDWAVTNNGAYHLRTEDLKKFCEDLKDVMNVASDILSAKSKIEGIEK